MSPHMPTSEKEAQKPQDWNFLQASPSPPLPRPRKWSLTPPKATHTPPGQCRYLSSETLLWTQRSQDLTRFALLLPASVCRDLKAKKR